MWVFFLSSALDSESAPQRTTTHPEWVVLIKNHVVGIVSAAGDANTRFIAFGECARVSVKHMVARVSVIFKIAALSC